MKAAIWRRHAWTNRLQTVLLILVGSSRILMESLKPDGGQEANQLIRKRDRAASQQAETRLPGQFHRNPRRTFRVSTCWSEPLRWNWSSLLLALRAIRRNLLRSFLTLLGIVIGVSAVITMVMLGKGATRAVSDQIAGLGGNLVMVRPGPRLGTGRDTAGAPNFKVSDAEAILAQRSVRSTRSRPSPTGV